MPEQAKHAVHSWQAMIETMLERLGMGVAILDLKGYVRRCNPTLSAWLARQPPKDRPVWELLSQNDGKTLRAAIGRLPTHTSTPEHCALQLPGNEIREATLDSVLSLSHSVCATGQDDTLICWILHRQSDDRAEAARLQAERTRLSRVVDNIPYGIMELDRAGSICFGNLALHRVFGYELGELHGEGVWLILDDEAEKRRFSHELAHILNEEPEPEPLFLRGLRKDGEVALLRMDWTYLRGLHGDVNGLLTVVTDITQQHAEEEERERLRRELQQAQKMEAIGQLTGGIAHDFNNMLAGIMGYAELTLENLDRASIETLHRYLEEVLRSCNRARELVAQMLLFSRSGASTAQPLALAPLIKEVTRMLQALLPSSIELRTRITPNLPYVLIEAVQIHQALINLCVNARDAMAGQGSIQIDLGWAHNLDAECHATHRPVKGDWIELSVSDTGCGIDPLILDHVFEPFFTTKSSGKGTGMGLAVLHKIVEQHDARVLVESEPGKGTRFRLLFRPDTSAAIEPTYLIEETSIVKTHRGSRHILVVDDEQAVAGFLRELLRNQGYRVTSYHDGLSAYGFLESGGDPPELIITDQTMPGLTGVELIRATRQLGYDMPIILCTGYSEYADESTALAAGAQVFILKPVDSAALLKTVAKLLPSETTTG